MWILLKGIENPISFEGAEELVPILEKVLRGWSFAQMAVPKGSPGIRILKGVMGYERRSPWIEGGVMVNPHPVDAVCDLLLDLKRAYVHASGDTGRGKVRDALLILHAAGVEMGHERGKGLVVFPSTHATGKSLLTVALARAGHRVFADDQLPITSRMPVEGCAPGFLPRLRRPLPSGLAPEVSAFIRAHEGPMSDQFQYVDLEEAQLAPLGERARIRGVVLPERRDGARPSLAPAAEAEVLKACVLQSFGRKMGALEVLDHLHAMILGAKCYKLAYGEAHEAVPVLEEAFA